MKLFHSLIIFSLLLFVACQNQADHSATTTTETTTTPPPVTEQLIEGFSAPESIISDGQYLYVSNVGEKLEPMTKDGDGFISQLDQEGNILNLKFITGLDAPKGMTISNRVLYVADVDKVRGFTLKDGEPIFELDFSKEGVQFLNDITALDDENFLVSSTDLGKIYKFKNAKKGSYQALNIEGNLAGVNGLFYDAKNNQLFTNSFGANNQPNGQVGRINMGVDKLRWRSIGKHQGGLDGIAFTTDQQILFSDWNTGGLLKMDFLSGETDTLVFDAKIKGPADFYYDENNQLLWIPQMQENKVLRKKLKM